MLLRASLVFGVSDESCVVVVEGIRRFRPAAARARGRPYASGNRSRVRSALFRLLQPRRLYRRSYFRWQCARRDVRRIRDKRRRQELQSRIARSPYSAGLSRTGEAIWRRSVRRIGLSRRLRHRYSDARRAWIEPASVFARYSAVVAGGGG